jgi:hypothetical protein
MEPHYVIISYFTEDDFKNKVIDEEAIRIIVTAGKCLPMFYKRSWKG